jgi:hypothetical protein
MTPLPPASVPVHNQEQRPIKMEINEYIFHLMRDSGSLLFAEAQ